MTRKDINPENWVDEYGDILYSYALSRIYNPETAQDLVQDTFLSGLKAIENFEQRSSIKTWLISILKRKIIDFYRKKSTSHEKLTNDLTKDWESDTSPFEPEGLNKGHWKEDRVPQVWDMSGQESMEKEEFQKALIKCISFLPPKWAACFTLKVIEEIPTDEVCKEIEITSSNLWVMLHRARLQLRECMEKNWVGLV